MVHLQYIMHLSSLQVAGSYRYLSQYTVLFRKGLVHGNTFIQRKKERNVRKIGYKTSKGCGRKCQCEGVGVHEG